jgi:hypothetical protein
MHGNKGYNNYYYYFADSSGAFICITPVWPVYNKPHHTQIEYIFGFCLL